MWKTRGEQGGYTLQQDIGVEVDEGENSVQAWRPRVVMAS